MNSTVRLTPLHPLDHEYVHTTRNSHSAGVKILDRNALESELKDTLRGQMDTRTKTEHNNYPRQEWDLLLGFTTWGKEDDDADYHNVSNTDPEDMALLFKRISKHTEPFVVWMTDFNGHWAHPTEIAGGSDEAIYECRANDGNVELERLRFEVSERDAVEL